MGLATDNYLRKEIKGLKTPRGIMISGVAPPPKHAECLFYDILWYETDWYLPQIKFHPNTVHAFGIDSNINKINPESPKEYDWISVGAFTAYKRYEKFCSFPGRRIAIGADNYADSKAIIASLNKAGIETRSFISHEALAKLLNKSHKSYIPASINGGGERAVLEARACGLQVKVENDNPKLLGLIQGPIWDHYYYANQLEKSMRNLLNLPT